MLQVRVPLPLAGERAYGKIEPQPDPASVTPNGPLQIAGGEAKQLLTAGPGGCWTGQDTFYEEGDSDYERWLGGEEVLRNKPPNILMTQDGPEITSMGFENYPPPPFKEAVRWEWDARQQAHAFSVRHVHVARGDAQKEHNARQVEPCPLRSAHPPSFCSDSHPVVTFWDEGVVAVFHEQNRAACACYA